MLEGLRQRLKVAEKEYSLRRLLNIEAGVALHPIGDIAGLGRLTEHAPAEPVPDLGGRRPLAKAYHF